MCRSSSHTNMMLIDRVIPQIFGSNTNIIPWFQFSIPEPGFGRTFAKTLWYMNDRPSSRCAGAHPTQTWYWLTRWFRKFFGSNTNIRPWFQFSIPEPGFGRKLAKNVWYKNDRPSSKCAGVHPTQTWCWLTGWFRKDAEGVSQISHDCFWAT